MKPINPIQFPTKSSSSALIALFLMALTTSAAEAPPEDCPKTLTEMSPCLPYISSPPNNLSSSPSSQCCDIFSSAFDRGGAACFCYLLRQPLLLGFPVNTSRTLSLSSLCSAKNETSTLRNSLNSLCEGSPTLPPLSSPSGSENSVSPSPIVQPESTACSSTPELGTNSSTLTINKGCQFRPRTMLSVIVPILAYL